MQSKAPLFSRSAGVSSAKLCRPQSNLRPGIRAQLIESPPASNDQSFAARQQTAARRQQTASALTVGVAERAPVLDAAPAIEASGSGSAADEALLRTLTYGANAGVLGSVAMAAAAGSGVLHIGDWHGLQVYGSALHDAYLSLMGGHPVGLKAAMSGLVFGMGDLTAQAYEGRGVSTIDWARTARSAAVGVIQGPLGHAVFSSDGCVIDRLVEQQGLEEWQQPLAKIVADQAALSLAWNSLYFGLLGAMRLDPPGNVLGQLWSSGFSLMKAGWRLWPLAHVVTYTVVPPEHRMLWVLMVELGWVSVLLFWSQQTALNDDGEADSWAAPATAAVVAAAEDAVLETLERLPSQEMRVLLMDSIDEEAGGSIDSSTWQPE